MRLLTLGMKSMIALLFSYSAAFGQDDASSQEAPKEPTRRVCVESDLVNHLFKLIELQETPSRNEALVYAGYPHQYLKFRPNNKYDSQIIDRQFDLKTVERGLSDPRFPRQYALSSEGILTLVEREKVKYAYRCVEVIKKEGNYIPGDIILTGYTKKRKSLLYKVYRRWY